MSMSLKKKVKDLEARVEALEEAAEAAAETPASEGSGGSS